MTRTKPRIFEVIQSGYFSAGILSAISFWIFDSAFDVIVFEHSKSFWQELVDLDIREIYFRSLISVSFISFGFMASLNTFKLKSASEQIKLNEERVSLLLNSTAEGVFGMGLDGECTFANQSCVKMLGYQSDEELLGKNMYELVHHAHRDGSTCMADDYLHQAGREGKEVHTETVLWRMDGGSFPAELRAVPLHNHEGVIGSVVTFTNIQERIEAEAIQAKTRLLNQKTIDVTTSFLKGEDDSSEVFTNIVENLLELTQSEFGFIGDVLYDQSGTPYLKSRAITDIAWDQASKDLYQPEGMEFRNLDSLFGQVITTKTRVLSNSPADDGRSGCLPKGHPPLNSFLGVPLMRGGDMIGMLGVANRPGGYDETDCNFIQPFTNVCSYILWCMQLNQELDDVKRRYQTLFDDAPIMYLTTSRSTHGEPIITKCNRLFLATLGYQEREVIGKPLTDFMSDASKQVLMKEGYAKAMKEGLRGEFRELVTKQGSIVSTELAAVPECGADGQVIGTRAMYVDISNQIKTHREHERIAKELMQLIDSANAPIIGIDIDGKLVEWNHYVATITGYSKEEVIGHDVIEDFIMEDYRTQVREMLDKALQGEVFTNIRFKLLTKEPGKMVDVLLNVSARLDTDGNIVGIIIIGQDVTELRQKDRALNQAKKMEAVGQLTGGIAHDFNNLLSVVKGNLRFLQQDVGDTNPGINRLLEDAMSAVDDGAELTQRLLGFSRNRSLQPEIKNVNETIEKFARFLSRTLGAGIELNTDLPDKILYINVDPSQLENALLNLSINARDAMPDGGTITIRVTQYEHGHGEGDGDGDGYSLALASGNYIKISVVDTGTGISSDNLQHVYEPFFTTKEVGKGSGLGLSMVYGFTQQSNGACYIDSTPGERTTVSMYFHEVTDRMVIKKLPDHAAASKSDSEVILVVEDEPRVRRITLRDLKNLGYKTLVAENAAVARTIIESGEHIDLLFTDVLMPGEMDGYQLAVWTKENYPETAIILTSGYSRNKTGIHNDIQSRFPLVRKPYAVDKVAKQIRTTLTEVKKQAVST